MKNRYNVPSKADRRTWGTLSMLCEVHHNPYGVRRIPERVSVCRSWFASADSPQGSGGVLQDA